jgi:hypothetical protein
LWRFAAPPTTGTQDIARVEARPCVWHNSCLLVAPFSYLLLPVSSCIAPHTEAKAPFPPYVDQKHPAIPSFLRANLSYFVGELDNCTNATAGQTCTPAAAAPCTVQLQGASRRVRYSSPPGSQPLLPTRCCRTAGCFYSGYSDRFHHGFCCAG